MLKGRVDGASVDQQILADDVARISTTQKGARATELFGCTEAIGGYRRHLCLGERFVVLSRLRSQFAKAVGLPIGREWPGQQVVDGDVVLGNLARKSRNETSETGSRRIGQSEMCERRLHRP